METAARFAAASSFLEQDDGGDTVYQILDIADFAINNREQFMQRRSATPSLNTRPDFT